jgi:hypothetical protein
MRNVLARDPDSLFKKVLKELRPVLKAEGFRASSQNFVLESAQCWAIINFQKSRWSSSNEKTFYVNVAITAKRLLSFDDEPADKAPAYYACIRQARAEQFDHGCRVKQWTLRNDEDVREVVGQLTNLLRRFVIPSVKSTLSEASLLSQWDGTDYRQLKARTVLLAADGKLPELRETIFMFVERFDNGVVSQGVRDHLDRLRSKFPVTMRQI